MDWLKKLLGESVKQATPAVAGAGLGALTALMQRQQQPQQMPAGMATGGYPQAMINDAAGFNYPGTMHQEQESNPRYNWTGDWPDQATGRPQMPNINFYQNPNGMYKRPQGSMPSRQDQRFFYQNNDF